MPFEFLPTEIPDVIKIVPRAFPDDRGFFFETYKKSDFTGAGITEEFVQDNHSKSTKDVIRGLYFQRNPAAQGKLVRCIQGAIWDVAVDLRSGSPTFGQWVASELTATPGRHFLMRVGMAPADLEIMNG